MSKLSPIFFSRPTRRTAQDLLGCFLVRRVGKKKISGMITEVEAYCGPRDLASHASKGRTKRTEIMFGPPGHYYVYLVYGMYYCLNIVTEKKDYPAAVLIRAVTVEGLPHTATNGPGKVCRYFKIDKRFNGLTVNNDQLWIEDRGSRVGKIKKLPRVGVAYAGDYVAKPWRYVLTPPLSS